MRTVYDNFPYSLVEDNLNLIRELLPSFDDAALVAVNNRVDKVSVGLSRYKRSGNVKVHSWDVLFILHDWGAVEIEELNYDERKSRDYLLRIKKRFEQGEIFYGKVGPSNLLDFKKKLDAVIHFTNSDPFSENKQILTLSKAILDKSNFLETDEFGIDETVLGEEHKHVDFCKTLETLSKMGLIECSISDINLSFDYSPGPTPHCKAAVIILPKLKEFLRANTAKNDDLQTGLLNIFPKNRKTYYIRRMAELLKDGHLVSNFELAKCLKSSLTKKKYKQSQSDFDREVQNRLRTLKKYLKKIKLSVKSVGEGYILQKL